MKLFMKTQNGKITTLLIDPKDTIANLKTRIQDIEGFLPECQQLTFNGKRLVDCRTLEDYDIEDEYTLYLSVYSGDMNVPISFVNGLTISDKRSLKWFGDFKGLCDFFIVLNLPYAKWTSPAVVQNFMKLKKFLSDGILQTEH